MTVPFPNFVVIGVQKSATRWLRDNLSEHPEIHVHHREIAFFNHHFDRGLDWYRTLIDAPPTARAVGDVTPGYLMWTDGPARTAARLSGALPGARLIALLRDPVERAASAYVHHARKGRLPDGPSLAELCAEDSDLLDGLGIVSGGWYARSLRPYLERFGDNLLVLRHDDVRDDPATLYRDVCRHLEVRDDVIPEGVREVKHSNRDAVPDAVLASAELTADERRQMWTTWFADEMTELERMLPIDIGPWRERNAAPQA